MKIEFEIDTDLLTRTIELAPDLDNNESLFGQLASIAKHKAVVVNALEQIEGLENQAKNKINAKAKELYGNDWQAIAGDGYKIIRLSTGSLYVRNPDEPIAKRFIEIKENLITKEIETEIEKTGKLPRGIELNPNRGESIRIKISDENT